MGVKVGGTSRGGENCNQNILCQEKNLFSVIRKEKRKIQMRANNETEDAHMTTLRILNQLTIQLNIFNAKIYLIC